MSEEKKRIRTTCLGNEKQVLARARHLKGCPARVLEKAESAVEGAAKEMNHQAVLALAKDLRLFSNESEGIFKRLLLCRSQFLDGIERLLAAAPETNSWVLRVVETIACNQQRLLRALGDVVSAERKAGEPKGVKAPEERKDDRPITVDDVLTLVAVGTESDAQLLAHLSGDAGKRS